MQPKKKKAVHAVSEIGGALTGHPGPSFSGPLYFDSAFYLACLLLYSGAQVLQMQTGGP
jgi:hypothetical protein